MLWMRVESGIMDAFNFRMFLQEHRNLGRVLAVRAHPPGQRLQAAMDQPTIEGRGNCATRVLNVADPLPEFVLRFRDDNAAKHVAMAAEIFGGGMQHKIDPEID